MYPLGDFSTIHSVQYCLLAAIYTEEKVGCSRPFTLTRSEIEEYKPRVYLKTGDLRRIERSVFLKRGVLRGQKKVVEICDANAAIVNAALEDYNGNRLNFS